MGQTSVSLRELGLGDECTADEFSEAFALMAEEIAATARPFCLWPDPRRTPEALALAAQIRSEIDALVHP